MKYLFSITFFTLIASIVRADVISCNSSYILLTGGKQSSEPGPDLSAEIDSSGNAFNRVEDASASMIYSISLQNGEGAIGLSLSENKNAAAVFGDLSATGKKLRLVFGDAILKTQGLIDITCVRQ